MEITHDVRGINLDAWTAFKLGCAFAAGTALVTVAIAGVVAGVAIAAEIELPQLRGDA